jgi:phosphoribosylamine--glycine ligase
VKALIVGSGGREHALAWKLSQSARFDKIYAAPGNPGIAGVAECIPVNSNPADYLTVARQLGADLTVVGPEAPLVAGVVDAFQRDGRRIVGPTAAAACLEASKTFTKEFLSINNIDTARFITIPSKHEAKGTIDAFGYPVVIKADGLAAGKGVIIARDRKEALDALDHIPPGKIVIEEFLTGEEVSFIVLADGKRVIPLAATQDHKAIGDGDIGPNTGGMGAYCDRNILTSEQTENILDRIIRPTLAGMAARNTPYTGFLYAGLMMTRDGPKVLEYNCRLGDPETQPLMHRLSSDLGDTLLDGAPFTWRDEPSVCVVLAAQGYPGAVRTGDRITGIDKAHARGATVYQAGTRAAGDTLETAGGRVLGVTASGADLAEAISNTYNAVSQIHFDGMQYRHDIGRKGLARTGS